MGDVVKTLFGGSESSSKPKDVTPADVEALRKSFGSTLQSIFKQGGAKPFEGPLTTGLGGNEQSLLNMLMQDANGASGRQGLLQQTLQGNFLPGQSGANPYLQSAIEAANRPVFQQLQETLDRTLPGLFTKGGQFIQYNPDQANGGSSAFVRAAGMAARDAQQTAADTAAKMSSAAFESERGRQQEAVQLSQQEVDTTLKNLEAQALPRLIEEVGIDRAIDLYKTGVQSLLEALRAASGASGMTNIGNVTKSESTGGIIPALLPKGLQGG